MNAENKLKALFENARNAKEIIALEAIEQNLNNTPKINNFYTPIILTTMSILIILLSWYGFLVQTETKKQTKNLEKPNSIVEQHLSKVSPLVKPEKKSQAKVWFDPIEEKNNVSEANEKLTKANVDLENKEPESAVAVVDSFYLKRKVNLKNIHLIELSEEELKSLGITVENAQIKVPITITESGGLVYSNYDKYGTVTTFNLKKKNSVPIMGKGQTFSLGNKVTFEVNDSLDAIFKKDPSKIHIPVADISKEKSDSIKKTFPLHTLVTDDLGQVWRSYRLDNGLTEDDYTYMRENNLNPNTYPKAIAARKNAEAQLIAKLPSYIPILVKSGDITDSLDKKSYRADIIVWFEPTEQLFKALPERITKALKKEYEAVFITKHKTEQCVYFEACQQNNDALKVFNVFPNPTDGAIQIEFELATEQTLNFEVFSINGQLIKVLQKETIYPKGKNALSRQIEELKEGMYLLVIQFENGTIVSKRVVKK